MFKCWNHFAVDIVLFEVKQALLTNTHRNVLHRTVMIVSYFFEMFSVSLAQPIDEFLFLSKELVYK